MVGRRAGKTRDSHVLQCQSVPITTASTFSGINGNVEKARGHLHKQLEVRISRKIGECYIWKLKWHQLSLMHSGSTSTMVGISSIRVVEFGRHMHNAGYSYS